jgi:UDP-GlcNAc3NAcA epimerase
MPSIATIVGARPQLIKSAPVSLALKAAGLHEILIHTGQHYDALMSDIFFEELSLKAPDHHLGIGSGSHGYQTGEALKRIEEILLKEQPDAVLVYGDTNATLSGALAAAKLHIPIAHVEAGLRSFNRRMPEEINRVLTDHVSTWLFAPTEDAVRHLATEGITRGVHPVGDVMLDAVRLFSDKADASAFLDGHGLTSKGYLLLTMHRAETSEQPEQMATILQVLDRQELPVLFPVHPRVRPMVEAMGPFRHIRCVPPLGYLEMLCAEKEARLIVTDSGGVQKEAAFLEVPCITLREETEWMETVSAGWNILAGLDADKLTEALGRSRNPMPIHHLYGDGMAREKIAGILQNALHGASVTATR